MYCKVKKQLSDWFKTPQVDTRDIRIAIELPQLPQKIFTFLDGQYMVTQEAKDIIRGWLVEVYEKILSDGFHLFETNKLKDTQVKSYTAKNILLNIYLFMKNIQNHFNINNFQNLRGKMFRLLEEQSENIIHFVILKYPQASAKEGARNLKEQIKQIDVRESEEFCLLRYSKKLGINWQHQNDNFFKEIMKVLNLVIGIGKQNLFNKDNQDNQDNKDKILTNFEGFSQFMELLFNYCGSKSFDQTFKNILLSHNSEIDPAKFHQLISMKSYNQQQLKQSKQENQKNKYFIICQKIPQTCPLFTDDEITSGKFSLNHPSILRVMIKWAEELNQKVQNPEKNIKNKQQSFKNYDGELTQLSNHHKEKITRKLQSKQYDIIKNYTQNLKSHCTKTCAMLTVQQQQKLPYLNQIDAKLGRLAANMQQTIGSYALANLNYLIDFLKALPGKSCAYSAIRTQQDRRQAQKLGQLNLISLKIGDLLRCKCKANQDQIISIYKMLIYITQTSPNLLKVIRVKNRLDEKDNDLLINIFFMDKIQCQIQLSVVSSVDTKQQKLNHFNHLVYQLKRSSFGPIAECACIMAQYDPLVNYFMKNKTSIQQIKLRNKKKYTITQNNKQYISNLPFFCKSCKKYMVFSNSEFYSNSWKESKCTKCYQSQNYNTKTVKMESIVQQLFRFKYKQDSDQMDKIKKHFVIANLQKVQSGDDLKNSVIQNQQAFIVKKNTRVPQPLFCKFICTKNQYYALSNEVNSQNKIKTKIVFQLDRVQNQVKKINNMIILKPKIGQKFKFLNQDDGECKLICQCCQPKQMILREAFSLKFQQLKKQDNRKKIKDAYEKRKQALSLPQTQITNQLSQINPNNQIKKLQINNNPNLNADFMHNFKKLTILNISQCNITDLSQLKINQYAKDLKSLKASFNNIKNLNGLNKLKELNKLILDHNEISSISNIQTLISLQQLHLCNNISQNRRVEKLQELNQLYLQFNLIKNIQNLKLHKIDYVNLSHNPIQMSTLKNLQNNCSAKQVVLKNTLLTKESLQVFNQVKRLQNLKIKVVI